MASNFDYILVGGVPVSEAVMVAASEAQKRRRQPASAASAADVVSRAGDLDTDVDGSDLGACDLSHLDDKASQTRNNAPRPRASGTKRTTTSASRKTKLTMADETIEELAHLKHMNEQLQKGAQKLNDDREELRQQHATDRAELARLNALLKEYQCRATAHDIGGCQFHQTAQLMEEENKALRTELIDLHHVYDLLTRSCVASGTRTVKAGDTFGDLLSEQTSVAESDGATRTDSASHHGTIDENLDTANEEIRATPFSTNDLHTTLNRPNNVCFAPESPFLPRDEFRTTQNYSSLFHTNPSSNISTRPAPSLKHKASQFFHTGSKLQQSKSLYNLSPDTNMDADAVATSPPDSICGWHSKGACRRTTANEALRTGAFCVLIYKDLRQNNITEEAPENTEEETTKNANEETAKSSFTARVSNMKKHFRFGRK
ncbi:hypothetical protein EJ03DRAFT_353248 [Teratosphaeria nubilosa]|uniref:Uncharacterized protein n=1 Tax=Teratosphaeria nubilosa TaxID=161662 RepID=A0A6G1L4P3_9PEZI|nr:hypothetical protein EJ03DRAFT_353248 [Teratosphaeria nubilosa]